MDSLSNTSVKHIPLQMWWKHHTHLNIVPASHISVTSYYFGREKKQCTRVVCASYVREFTKLCTDITSERGVHVEKQVVSIRGLSGYKFQVHHTTMWADVMHMAKQVKFLSHEDSKKRKSSILHQFTRASPSVGTHGVWFGGGNPLENPRGSSSGSLPWLPATGHTPRGLGYRS